MRQVIRQAVPAAMILLLIPASSGCSTLLGTNHRIYERDNIAAGGLFQHELEGHPVHYHRLSMGNPNAPIEGSMPALIELNDKPMTAKELTFNFVSNHGKEVERDMQWHSLGGYWPPSQVYQIGPYYFRFIDGRLINIEIYARSDDAPPAILWDKQQSHRYVFPLSQDDVEKLFGPPIKQRDLVKGAL